MFRFRRNYRRNTTVTSTSNRINISKNRQVNNLCKTFAHYHVLSVLNQLEDYRLTSNEADFKKLVLMLLRAFNDSRWRSFASEQRDQFIRRVSTSKNEQYFQNTSCYLVIIFYILSIIKKYNISNTNEIWKEIIKHHSISKPEFFEYLYKNRIIVPVDLHPMLYERMDKLYTVHQSENVLSRLLRVGYCSPDNIGPNTSPQFLEKMFSAVSKNKVQCWKDSEDLANRIWPMKKPEHLSLCLSYCRDYDLNQVRFSTNRNVLDEVMIMETDFPRDVLSQRSIGSITLRIIRLIQQLIYCGARLSKPIFSQYFRDVSQYGFSLTTIGIYVMLSIGIDNINPPEISVSDYDERFLKFIFTQIKIFRQPFQDMMLHHLVISCPFIHKEKIINSQRQNEQTDESIMNNKLFQTSLTLKQWCRLKIRENCSQKNIRQLNISRKLIDYCSYGLSNSNFAAQCIEKVIQHDSGRTHSYFRHPIFF